MRTVGDLPKLQMGMGIAGVIDDGSFSALDGGFEIFLCCGWIRAFID